MFKINRVYLRGFAARSHFGEKKKIVFLGTPDVAADVLESLYVESKGPSSMFEICKIVSQPASPGKGKRLVKSPVQVKAEALHLPVVTPENAKDDEFLKMLESENIDLCITAAYGNYLPRRFLAIPKFGTVNIHPSLLPKYRGAAPVQRCLENGDTCSGVTLLYTVSKMDSGPIISQISKTLHGDELSPPLMKELFAEGTKELVKIIPKIFQSEITMNSNVSFQNDDLATQAPKLGTSESLITFDHAKNIYNKYRAFYGWPEIYAYFRIKLSETIKNFDAVLRIKLKKIIMLPETEMESKYSSALAEFKVKNHAVIFRKYHSNPKEMVGIIRCQDGNYLGILEMQAEHRNIVNALSFFNGYSGKFDMTWLNDKDLCALHLQTPK